MMVEVAKTQTTKWGMERQPPSLWLGELLKRAEDLLDQDLHPTVIVDGYRIASRKKHWRFLTIFAIKVDPTDKAM